MDLFDNADLLLGGNTNRPVVLVVDDVPENLQTIGIHLDNAGYDTAFASSGYEALQILDVMEPDLILLDVSMPVMDGFEVCKRIKSVEKTAKIPVIFLTAHTDTERVVEGLTLGAVDYVTKPFHTHELLMRVKTHISLYRAYETVKRQNESLHVLNQEKSNMLSIAAHDLKNPMQAIVLAVDLMEVFAQKKNFDGVQYHADKVRVMIDRMLTIVENWLSLHSYEVNKLNIKNEHIDLVKIVESSTDSYTGKANAKNIELTITNNCDEAVIMGDKSYLEEVFDNIISNALKYSPIGGNVNVKVYEKDGNYIVSVEDSGQGIAVEEYDKLFKKFSKLSTRPTAGESSSGLGLAIVKHLVEAMNGDVWCESTHGKGATFKVALRKV